MFKICCDRGTLSTHATIASAFAAVKKLGAIILSNSANELLCRGRLDCHVNSVYITVDDTVVDGAVQAEIERYERSLKWRGYRRFVAIALVITIGFVLQHMPA